MERAEADPQPAVVTPAGVVERDLAWGLAKRGIAVYRYDKRTKVAAILRGQPQVDPGEVFILGHSQDYAGWKQAFQGHSGATFKFLRFAKVLKDF